MLKKLCVQNFALIENQTIDFENALVVLSGETGAGKSIFISAITFMLGNRADKSFIRHGESFARVEGVFEIDKNNSAKNECLNLGIDVEDELIISRKLCLDGKSEIRVNGVLTTLNNLNKITMSLVDIYGQHQHQQLLDTTTHIDFLDDYKRDDDSLAGLEKVVCEIGLINKQLAEFGEDEGAWQREKDRLEFELAELDEANLQLCEDEELEAQFKKMQNAQSIVQSLSGAAECLSNESASVSCALYNASKMLLGSVNFGKDMEDLHSRLESARIEVDDIVESLKDACQSFDFSEMEFEQIEQRLSKLKNIKRKYGGSIESALEYKNNAEQKLEFLNNSAEKIEQLKTQKQALIEIGNQLSEKISAKRKEVANEIAQKLKEELESLGMKNTQLVVDFKRTATFTSRGFDEVEFLFSANMGEPPKPLAKIISGGEMSRFMLAFKTILGASSKVETLIFDEIDSGIGGEVGLAVACKMANLAKSYQVIVITHLATIGAMADQHFFIQKSFDSERTTTQITLLSKEEQIREIARLAGGYSGVFANEYAKQLKMRANQIKN